MQSDRIIVNSNFTADQFARAFPSASSVGKPLVLYPGVSCRSKRCMAVTRDCSQGKILFCLQRFDRKKNVGLAIGALVRLRSQIPPDDYDQYKLVIAGGYDRRVRENADYLQELRTACDQSGLFHETLCVRPLEAIRASPAKVVFLPSVEDGVKDELFAAAFLLLFTAPEEHFGIVPVEAMLHGLPVIAVDAGGPRETIVDSRTGFLVQDSPEAMARCIRNVSTMYEHGQLSRQAQEHARAHFGLDRFGTALEEIVQSLAGE